VDQGSVAKMHRRFDRKHTLLQERQLISGQRQLKQHIAADAVLPKFVTHIIIMSMFEQYEHTLCQLHRNRNFHFSFLFVHTFHKLITPMPLDQCFSTGVPPNWRVRPVVSKGSVGPPVLS